MRTGGVDDYPKESRFQLLSHRYWPDGNPDRTWSRSWRQPATFHRGDEGSGPYWSWRFIGEPPGDLRLHQPLLRILRSDNRGTLVDDESGDMRLRLIDGDVDGQGLYEVRWYHPPVAEEGRFQLEVRAGANAPALISPAFP